MWHPDSLGRRGATVKRIPRPCLGHWPGRGIVGSMARRGIWVTGALLAASVLGLAGCQRAERKLPPPDARRPEIKSEAQLAAERDERIRAGEVVPTSAPTLAADRVSSAARRPPPIQPAPGAIEPDILIVNDAVLTVAEVLYPLRDQLTEVRRSHTSAGFLEEARRVIRRQAQQEIGTLLVYAEARGQLADEQKKTLDTAVDKELDNMTSREFAGSQAKFAAHLKENGLTKEQFREALARNMVVRQYSREKLMPQVQIRRDELLGFYRSNLSRFSTTETRELLLIELPLEKFLPEGRPWERASGAERAQAKLKATRRIREAREALAGRPFEDVAREVSFGLHAENGGSWGMIGRPLQAPYEDLSKLVFEHDEGWVSAPIETETGWYIVKCGRIVPANQRTFVEVQDEIRSELMERRFTRLSVDYVLKLAENATISSLDAFVATAVQRAERLTAGAVAKSD